MQQTRVQNLQSVDVTLHTEHCRLQLVVDQACGGEDRHPADSEIEELEGVIHTGYHSELVFGCQP